MKASHLLQKPPRYVVASILCSLGGFLFGIDTGIIGPVTVMPQFTKPFGRPSPTIHGLIVSSILIPAAITSLLAGRVADTLGRPKAISIGSLIFAIGAVIEASAVHVAMFIGGRVIAGFGEGIYMGTLVVYICEISPAKYRGPFTTGPQLLITCGLVTGFFTCYGSANIESTLSWRLPFILLAVCSALFSGVALLLPASPRWLAFHGRTRVQVREAWDLLDVRGADQDSIPDQEEIEEDRTSSRMLDVFSAEARPRFILAVFIMGAQQLSGIDGVLYYAPLLFKQAGISSDSGTFLASGVSAIVIFAVTIPATIWADSWGRRRNVIMGGLGMAMVMFTIGALYAKDAVHAHGAGRWIVIIGIYVFIVIFCITWAISVKVYAAEIQPQRTRASATNIAHGGNWLTNFLVALVTPTLLATTSYGAYFLFGGCTFVTTGVCWVFMRETRGRTLTEIEAAFQISRLIELKDSVASVGRKMRRVKPITAVKE